MNSFQYKTMAGKAGKAGIEVFLATVLADHVAFLAQYPPEIVIPFLAAAFRAGRNFLKNRFKIAIF